MSYILEALKKSQAERQLGDTPTIHAPQLPLPPAPGNGGVARLPLWLGMGGLTVVLALVLLAWRPWQVPVQPPAAAAAAAASVAAVPPASAEPAVSAAAVSAAAAALPEPAPAPVPAPAPAPVASTVPPGPALAAAPAAVPAPVPAPASAPSDDNLPSLRELPEPIQRQIPPLALGGYMYSSNPADRLLLIDKVLRHEGEEVAPGLVLEKLQPKAAIFSFKGYRYRSPY